MQAGSQLLELVHHLDNKDGDCDGEDGDLTLMVTVDLNDDIVLYMYASRSTNNCWPRLG